MRPKHVASKHRLFTAMLLWVCCFSVGAQDRFNVAVITDGPQYQLEEVAQQFQDELISLTSGEFIVAYRLIPADWSVASVNAAFETAYADPQIDMVLVLGFAGNQLAIAREQFPKPTFLPLVFNPELLGAPVEQNRSGRRNLNYLADRAPFADDLEVFQRIVPFDHAAILVDAEILKAIPHAGEMLKAQGPGVQFSFVGHDGTDNDLIRRLPADAEVVFLGGLPRLPTARFDQLLEDLAGRGLPSFSLVSENEVRRGALAANTVTTDYGRLARRNALNMQAVMLGERAEDQPIFFDGKRQLTINMATARTIGLSPRFDVLSEAELINVDPGAEGPALGLETVARLALERNLDLVVADYDVTIGAQDVLSARSNLLPQINVAAGTTLRRDQALARGPGAAERSTSGSLNLTQTVYSDAAWSGYQQQQFLQQARQSSLEAVRLDVIQLATVSYLQALRAETQLKIQQDNLTLTKRNLELARDRVRVGSASNADVFRWEANLATARASVLSSLAIRNQAYEALNRILNQPITDPINLRPADKEEPFVISSQEFDALINSPQRFGWLVDFSVDIGLQQSPELAQLDAQMSALERDVLSRQRAFWLPDVALEAQYADSIDASGTGSGTEFDRLNDWNVSLNASLPLFAGNRRRAELSRSTLQREQLVVQRAALRERVEQDVRASLHATQASYVNIELSEQAAEASRKNLDLVTDAYTQGTVNIIQLLDAQNQSLQADLSANNAVHDFLIEVMGLQRATSEFDFMLPPARQADRTQEFLDYIQRRADQTRPIGANP